MQRQNFEGLESQIDNQLTAVKFVRRKISHIPCSFEDRIYIYYIEFGGAIGATEMINEEGYRIPSKTGGRKYVTSDITLIIRSNKNNDLIDPALRYVVTEMISRKNGYIKFLTLLLKVAFEAYEKFGD